MKKKYMLLYFLYTVLSIAAALYMLIIKNDSRWILGIVGIVFVLLPPLTDKLFKSNSYYLSLEILFFVFIAYQLGVTCRFYSLFKYYDLLVHGLSGVFFTRIGICLGNKISDVNNLKQQKFVLLFALFFSMTIAVLWEFYEYFGFELFQYDAQLLSISGIKDTMEDMMICLAGSLLCSILGLYHYTKHKLSFFRNIDEFSEK